MLKELKIYFAVCPCQNTNEIHFKCVVATDNFQHRSTWTASAPVWINGQGEHSLPPEATFAKNMRTHKSKITKDTKQAPLLWM